MRTPSLILSLLLIMSTSLSAAPDDVPAAAPSGAAFDYPEATRGPVVDDYFGTRVADPYRWLEDVDAPATRAWVQAQNALSLPYLAALPEREAIRARLTALWNYPRASVVKKVAGKRFFTRNDGLQNQSVLWVQDSAEAAPRLLLDPNRLSADGTVALTDTAVSPDGKWLAYATAAAGSDWNEIRVRAVASDADRDAGLAADPNADPKDVLRRVKFSALAWTHDSKGFFYSRYPDPPAGAAPGTFDDLANQALYFHRLGTPQDQDLRVHAQAGQPRYGYIGEVTEDGRYLIVTTWRGSANEYLVDVRGLGDPDEPEFDRAPIPLIDRFEAEYAFIGNVGAQLYFRTNLDAPRGRIVAIDLDRPQREHWRTIVPQQADTLQHAVFAGDGLVVLTLHDAHSRLLRYALDGTPQGEIALPGLGSVPELALGGVQINGAPGDDELFYGYTSFSQPQTTYVHDLKRRSSRALHTPKLAFDPADYVTEQVFYPSRDGTRIPLFISYRKGLKRDGRAPTHLYGYGGFDISLTPAFSVANLLWMEMGGVYAQANLRGGGEYGSQWHEAGTLERKQNVFDDFAAAAHYLIDSGWTSPAHLAISGRSNGGLLVGATLNQHPELFAAALPAVGVMDMLRYHRFTIGWAWAGDYGTSETEAGFRTLIRYSPLHTIREGARYPAVLVTTADHDDRVVPGHSYKYAAALQHAQAGAAPILIRVDVDAGHGAGKPVGKLIEEEADKLAFMRHFTAGRGEAQSPTPPAQP